MALKIIKTSDLEEISTCNDESFLTITQKISEDNFISNKMQIKNLPLDNYYKKADINELLKTYSKTTHNHDFNSLSNLPTTLSGYGITDVYTKTEINNKNFLTEHQDISGKQNKLKAGTNITISDDNTISADGVKINDTKKDTTTTYSSSKIETIKSELQQSIDNVSTGGSTALTNYYTKTEIDNKYSLKTHNHAISDITNLQATLDSKAPEKYNLYYTGTISSKFKEKIIGTTDECGFVKSFRKQDNTDACMPQYGSGVAWGQSDSFGMLYSNYEKPIAYVAGGSTNGLRWSKQLAWKDDITNLQTTLDGKASSTHNHDSVYVKQDGSTPITSRQQLKMGSYVFEAHAGNGTEGYALVAEFKISKNYQNTPIKIELARRGVLYSNITIQFRNTDSPDPTLQNFVYEGSDCMAYMVKVDTSTWNLYIRKTESYDVIFITKYSNPNSAITTIWKESIFTSLPEGGTYATPLQHSISEITNLQTILDGKLSTDNGLISTKSGCIILSNTQGYLGKDKTGATHVIGLIGNDNYCYLGGNLINTYIRSKDCPQYLDSKGNKYNFYHTGNFNPSNYFSRSGQNTTNLNTCYDVGIYFYTDSTTGAPNRQYGHILNTVSSGNKYNGSNNWLSQLAFNTDDTIWHRSKVNSGGWTNWTKLVKTTDLNNYLPKSGGTMTGSISFPQGFGIESSTNTGKGLLKETSTSVNVGFTGKAIRLYGSSISYNDTHVVTGTGYTQVLFYGTTGGRTLINSDNCMKITTSSDSYYPEFTPPNIGNYIFMVNGSASASGPLCVNHEPLYTPSSGQYSGVKSLHMWASEKATLRIMPSGNIETGLPYGIDIIVMEIH